MKVIEKIVDALTGEETIVERDETKAEINPIGIPNKSMVYIT